MSSVPSAVKKFERKTMKKSICHYSFHRRYVAEKWSTDRLVQEMQACGAEGVDFHARMVGEPEAALAQMQATMAKCPLPLSSLSLSSDFNKPTAEALKAEVDGVTRWLDVAIKLGSPICRIFGGYCSLPDRLNPAAKAVAWQRMIDGVAAVTKEAAKRGIVLALENHGGLPCTGEEQVKAIETINSPHLRATIDVGNYMGGGQEGHVGTAIAAKYCAYVHLKDNKKVPDPARPWGWNVESCVVGEGCVDLAACIESVRKAGYNGFVGLEYEGAEDEVTGVPKSMATLNRLVK